MICPKCQNSISANARFCEVCGQAVPPQVAPDVAIVAGAGVSAGAAAATWPGAQPSLAPMPGLVQRIKNILMTPRTEWPVVAAEPTPTAQLFTGYVVPLSVFAAVLAFIHMSIIGVTLPFGGAYRAPVISGLTSAVLTLVFACIGVFLIGIIINALAPTFGGNRDLRQALKASAYSLTAAYTGSVLALSPVLATLLQLLAGCYGIYLLYLGLPVVMRSPRERAVGYTATVVVCTIVLAIVFALVSAALGLAGRSTGLLGSRAAVEEQNTAAVANAIGGALGTDAKGKAGLAAALNNLAKAGEQSEAANAAARAAGSNGTTAAANPQNSAAAVGGLVTALGGALGGDHPHAPVDFRSLTALLPASLPGMKRTDARGESQGAAGVSASSATGTYQGDNGTGVHIQIIDMTAVSGLMGMAASVAQSTTSESSTGYEKNADVDGHSVHEKYDSTSKRAELSVILAKRFQVALTGQGVDMSALEQDLGSVDLSRLEAMKDQGGTTK